MKTLDLGLTSYNDALAEQLRHVEAVRVSGAPDILLLTEHRPVYTIGARPGSAHHLLWNTETLAHAGIEVVTTNRGGDITYHGPGQIVGYPILNLTHRRDLHRYLRDLEEVLIRTVAHFGLYATRREGKTGIWIETRKIAAIGVAVKSWVTYHGFALNVCPDLSHFAGIVPCGIVDGTVTSLKAEGAAPEETAMDAVKNVLILEFWRQFADR